MADTIRCAVVGYGPNEYFGRMHARWIQATPGLELAAICDISPASRATAAADFPEARVFASLGELLNADAAGLLTITTPHSTHAPLAIQALSAGRHVLVDKPMATTVADCTAMIEAAQRAGTTLAVFHNRRHDGNYRAIKALVDEGAIGDVFRVECCEESFRHPGHGWYAKQAVSGGVFFYWGPHAVDWVLGLVPSRVVGVTASTQKRVWMDVDIDDEIRATLHFESGATALVTFSFISATRPPLWRILGTCGAIENGTRGAVSGASIPGYTKELQVGPCGAVTLVTQADGERQERQVPYLTSDWLTYYQDLAAHLLHGAPVPVSAEEGRRAVAVLEAAGRAARSGRVEAVEYG